MKAEVTELKIKPEDWESGIKATWCPGCGDHGVLKATKDALVALQIDPNNTVVVSGIGCSSNFPHFLAGYGIHSIHGRSNPVAEAVKLTNPDLTVIAAGGDGDGVGIGLGGFMHAARRNFNMTYIIMNNSIYGLTTGQTSPTSRIDHITKSTPFGNIEYPLSPVSMAIAAGATFVARTFANDRKHFVEVMKKAIAHKGFAFVDALSPCVSFNKLNTAKYYSERVYHLEDTDYNPRDKAAAFEKGFEWGDKIPIGVFYELVDENGNPIKQTYEEMDPTIKRFGNVIKRGAQRLDPAAKETILNDLL